MADLSIVEVTMHSREAIEAAIKKTEYKYFGDYEMSDDQREAVDILVDVARHRASDAERVREACAKVCDEVEQQQDNDHGAANTGGAAACGAAIRSLPIGDA